MPLSRIVSDSRAHLRDVGEGYWQHMAFAGAVASMLVAAGLACALHAVVPAWCRSTASRTIGALTGIIADRARMPAAVREAAEAVAFTALLLLALSLGAALWIAGAAVLLAVPLTLIALAIPAALLITNPDLEATPA